MKNALIIGGDGTIGTALGRALESRNINYSATTRAELDLAAPPKHWPSLPAAEVAYICAAITKLEECEREPAATYLVNVTHTQALIERLQAAGSYVVFLSSNQVFDGSAPFRKAADAPSPMNEYGRQKAEVERWLLAREEPSAILRLTKVVSGALPILAQWEAALKNGETVEAFDDLIFAPLPLAEAVDALLAIGGKKPQGIVQLGGGRDVSYYRLALELAEKLGIDKGRVKPISATTKNIPPQFLPKHGTLENSTI